MKRLLSQTVNAFCASESGQDLIEYGLLISLIAIVAMAGVASFGTTINNVFWTMIANNV